MRITPISEQEADAAASGLWDNGTYDFEVLEAEEKESNAGNDMIALVIRISNKEGATRKVFDYLVSSEGAAWKIRHFAASCGLLPQYEKGALIANEMVGRTGECVIATQAARGDYPAKNTVRDYVKQAGVVASRSSPAKAPVGAGVGNDLDDEIPFAPCWQ